MAAILGDAARVSPHNLPRRPAPVVLCRAGDDRERPIVERIPLKPGDKVPHFTLLVYFYPGA